MADIFRDIGRTITEPIGNLWQGAYRGLAPGAFQQAQLARDIQKIRAAGGVSTEAGRAMLAEMSGAYNPDMFVNPYEQAKTNYLFGIGTRGATPGLHEELEYWEKRLRESVDPAWGQAGGVLNQQLYDTAQQNIKRILDEMRRAPTERPGRTAFGGMDVGAKALPTGETGVYEQPVQEPTRREAGLPKAGGWAGAIAGESLTGYPRLQSIAESRNQFREWQPMTSSASAELESMPLTQGSLMSKIAKIKDSKGVDMGTMRAGKIVKQYPTVSNYLVTLKPSEVREIIGAIEDGLSEAEILKYFSNE